MEWNSVVDLVHLRDPWYKNNGLIVLNLALVVPLLAASINGFDSSCLNGLQLLPDWQNYFHNPKGTALGILNATQNLGSLVALPIAPYLSDGIGRKRTLLFGSVIMIGGVALQVLSTTLSHFIASRALIGFGLCFATNSAPLLITELAYPTQRGPATALYNSLWYCGSIISGWVTFAAFESNSGSPWSWRIPSIIQGIGSAVQCCLIWFIPESPRWLISKGRDTEAMEILARYHADGGSIRDPLVVFEWTQIRHALQLEREINKSTSWLALIKSPGNRKRLRIIFAIGLFSQWSGNGLVSYYISIVLDNLGISDPQTTTLINACLQIWNLIVAVTAALMVDRMGRRPLFLSSNAGMFVVFSMLTLTTALFATEQNEGAAKGAIALMFAFYFFYDLAYTPCLVAYTIEILPFNIRAKGFALMNMTVCATLAFNQFVNPWALKAMNWKYYLVYCGWLLFELLFVFRYVIETRGRTLEETAAIFDGKREETQLHEVGQIAATASLRQFPPAGLTRRQPSSRILDEEYQHPEEVYHPSEKSDFETVSVSRHGDEPGSVLSMGFPSSPGALEPMVIRKPSSAKLLP